MNERLIYAGEREVGRAQKLSIGKGLHCMILHRDSEGCCEIHRPSKGG